MENNLVVSQKSQNYLRRHIVTITLEFNFTKNYGRRFGRFPKIPNIICDDIKKLSSLLINIKYSSNILNSYKLDGVVLYLFATIFWTFATTHVIANTNWF